MWPRARAFPKVYCCRDCVSSRRAEGRRVVVGGPARQVVGDEEGVRAKTENRIRSNRRRYRRCHSHALHSVPRVGFAKHARLPVVVVVVVVVIVVVVLVFVVVVVAVTVTSSQTVLPAQQ